MTNWKEWPYVWSPNGRRMAHYKLWIQWFVNPIYKKGIRMNEQVNQLDAAKKLENPAKLADVQAVQTPEDRGEDAVEVKPDAPRPM